jgi:hypothetical protein
LGDYLADEKKKVASLALGEMCLGLAHAKPLFFSYWILGELYVGHTKISHSFSVSSFLSDFGHPESVFPNLTDTKHPPVGRDTVRLMGDKMGKQLLDLEVLA